MSSAKARTVPWGAVVLRKTLRCGSTAKLNSMPDIGHPCATPLRQVMRWVV